MMGRKQRSMRANVCLMIHGQVLQAARMVALHPTVFGICCIRRAAASSSLVSDGAAPCVHMLQVHEGGALMRYLIVSFEHKSEWKLGDSSELVCRMFKHNTPVFFQDLTQHMKRTDVAWRTQRL